MIDPVDGIVFYDTETTGLWPWPLLSRKKQKCAYDRPFMFQFENLEGDQYWFRADVNPKTREVDYEPIREELRDLAELWADPSITFVAHNSQFDILHTEATSQDQGFGRGWLPPPFKWRGTWDDTLWLAHVSSPDEMTFALKALTKRHCQMDNEDEKFLKRATQRARREAKKLGLMIADKPTHGNKPADADFWLPYVMFPDEDDPAVEYGLEDVTRVSMLWHMYREIINSRYAERKDCKLWDIYKQEQQLAKTVKRMTHYGVTYLGSDDLQAEYRAQMSHHRKNIDKAGYEDLVPTNDHHLRRVFCKEKGYKTLRRTDPSKRFPMGQAKCDAEQLLRWARGESVIKKSLDTPDGKDGDTLARDILEWKAAKKAVEYLESYDFFSCKRADGSLVIHPGWRQIGPVTGRFSCGEPNVMQIADAGTGRRHARIRPMQRGVFGPRPGHIWYMWDYSQYEIWIFMFDAGIEDVMDKMMRGWDGHTTITDVVWKDHPDFKKAVEGMKKYKPGTREYLLAETTHHYYRNTNKMVVFTKFYGGSENTVAYRLQLPKSEAKEVWDRIEEKLPGIPKYQKRIMNEIFKNGFLKNLLGREYHLPKRFAYKGVNYRVQGSQADLLKRAMVRIDKMFRTKWKFGKLRPHMFLTLHDELGFEIPLELHCKRLMNDIAECLQADSHLIPGNKVKLPVKCKIVTKNWLEGKVIKFASPLAE